MPCQAPKDDTKERVRKDGSLILQNVLPVTAKCIKAEFSTATITWLVFRFVKDGCTTEQILSN